MEQMVLENEKRMKLAVAVRYATKITPGVGLSMTGSFYSLLRIHTPNAVRHVVLDGNSDSPELARFLSEGLATMLMEDVSVYEAAANAPTE